MGRTRHGEHYTKATEEATHWCNKCSKFTQWQVSNGRRTNCLTCYERRRNEWKQRNAQLQLFAPR